MTVNLDRGSNDLEEVIDRLQKQKEYLQGQLRKTKSNRAEEIMALYAEVKRLKNQKQVLETNIYKLKKLHNAKVLEKKEEIDDRKANDKTYA